MKAIRTTLLLTLLAVLSLSFVQQSEAKVYASNVRFTQESSTAPFDGSFADRSGMAVRYFLNHTADSVVINIVPALGGPAVKTLRKSNVAGGDNVMVWNGSTNANAPAPAAGYKAQVIAYHRGFASYTQYYYTDEYPISTRGVTTINNPSLSKFGYLYALSTATNTPPRVYPLGVTRHASFGVAWGDSGRGSALVLSTGLTVGSSNRRYAPVADSTGYVYFIGVDERRIFRFHVDTMNVALFDSSAFGMRIQGLNVRGVGANRTLYVTGDSSIFKIVIGNQNFNTVPPTTIARVTPGKRMVFWDAVPGQDNSLYAIWRADSAMGSFPGPSRGVMKFNLSTGSLPKTFADTVWTNRIPDGDPVTLALNDGATSAITDDILYMNTDLGVPNTFASGIYEYTSLGSAAPTRAVAWADPDNNCSSTRSAVAVDALGNLAYFENSNEQVVLVSPPSGPNSYTYTSYDQVTVTAAGIAPILYTIGEARIDLNGDRKPDKLNDTVKVIGIINSVNVQTTNFGYFFQDSTGGMQIFKGGLVGAPSVRPGYRVQVIGQIQYFRGTTEIVPGNLATDITILDSGNVLTPIPVTITQYVANPEFYESRLIQFPVAQPYSFTAAQWPATGSSANLTIWNGQDTTILRIDSDTEVDGSPYPTWPVRLNGVGTQFTSVATSDTDGYQITPMFISDFVAINAPPNSNFRLLSPTNGSSIVIDTTASYTFRWRKAVDFNNDALIYQFKPVAFAGVLSNNAGADTTITRTGAQLLTYLGNSESSNFRWTVLAKDTPNPVVSSRDTFSVNLFRTSTPPAAGWNAQTSGLTTYLYSVKAVGPGVAWAAGAAGKVLRTTNGGAAWTSVGGGNIGAADIYNVDAISTTTAFVTTTPSTTTYIFRTTNGGTSWDTVYTQVGGFIDAIKMFDASNGIAVGDPVGGKWTIVKTTNGGTSWARITTEPAQVASEAGTQNGLCTVGSQYIWFNSGVGGRIYRSTDGGTTWSSGVAPFPATSNVWFNDSQYGVATGSAASGVARSTNGGATWTSVTVAGTGFLIACAGSGQNDFWYARGTTIYRSTDRGATFASSYVGTGSYVGLSFVTYYPSTSGWAVTSAGGIAGFSGATTTAVGEQQTAAIPETFELSQNYPNPFNPSTTIRYSLPKDAFVSLKIYNIIGQEIATLKEEFQNVGTFTIVWNGRNKSGNQVASGMYLYRIEARPADGGQPFTSLKKMVLLK